MASKCVNCHSHPGTLFQANIINYIRKDFSIARSHENKPEMIFYLEVSFNFCIFAPHFKIYTKMTKNDKPSVDSMVELLKPGFDALMKQGKITQKEIKTKRKTK